MIERLYEMLQEKELEMHLRSFDRILFLVSEDEMLSLATKIRQHELYIIKITHDSLLGFALFPMHFFPSISQTVNSPLYKTKWPQPQLLSVRGTQNVALPKVHSGSSRSLK